MRRLNGWTDDQTSMFEVMLKDDYKDEESMQAASDRISDVIYEHLSEDDDLLMAVSSVQRFPNVFEWLSLIDFNVVFVLILMIAVAGVNMITGLLIMLFENISTIGLLIGNALAIVFCLIQGTTHFIPLDPENYFVSYVPVHLDLISVLFADIVAFVAIMILQILPSLFVLRVDPVKTIKMD